MSDNPYIGPYAYSEKQGDLLFGRESELEDLSSLLVAERIVLLYSTSGAGKTSLVQAKLRACMEGYRFRVLPTTRVLDPLPKKGCSKGANRYVFSLLRRLEDPKTVRDAGAEPLSDAVLSRLVLKDYFARRPWITSGNWPNLLIVDQFEEILTTDPADHEGRERFFGELGEALCEPNLWVLLSMREEYLAGLDPFQRLVPTRFKNRYRLELLRPAEAAKAITKPAESHNVTFEPKAVEKLTRNLTGGGEATDNGTEQPRRSVFIEPLHLQVVCHYLWEHRELGKSSIDVGEVEATGDVDEALGRYYDDAVKSVADGDRDKEREIREWLDGQLITRQGIRTQVFKGRQEFVGLDDLLVKGLMEHRLVRLESHHGEDWVELAHDRLVDVVLRCNASWYSTNLRDVQAQARAWEDSGYQDGMLWVGDVLKNARQWASQQREKGRKLRDREERFLEKSQKKQKLKTILGWASIVLLMMTTGLLWMSIMFGNTIKELRDSKTTQERQLGDLEIKKGELRVENKRLQVAQTESRRNALDSAIQLVRSHAMQNRWVFHNHEVAALLALQSHRDNEGYRLEGKRNKDPKVSKAIRTKALLNEVLANQSIHMAFHVQAFSHSPTTAREDREFDVVAVAPKSRRLAVSSRERTIAEYRLQGNRKRSNAPYPQTERRIIRLAYSAKDRYLAAVTPAGVELFSVESGARLGVFSVDEGSAEPAGLVVFSADDSTLGLALEDGRIAVWPLGDSTVGGGKATLYPAPKDNARITAITLDAGSGRLAAGGSQGEIWLWDAPSRPRLLQPARKLGAGREGEARVAWMGFLPGRGVLAVVFQGSIRSRGGSTWLFDPARAGRGWKLEQSAVSRARMGRTVHFAAVPPEKQRLTSGAVSADGRRLAVGGEQGLVAYWTLPAKLRLLSSEEKIELDYQVLYGLRGRLDSLTLADGGLLAGTDSSGSMRIWKLPGIGVEAEKSRLLPGYAGLRVFKQSARAVLALQQDGELYLLAGCGKAGHSCGPQGETIKSFGATEKPLWKEVVQYRDGKRGLDNIRDLAVDPTGRLVAVATGGSNGRVEVLDRQDNFRTLFEHEFHNTGVTAVGLAVYGNRLVLAAATWESKEVVLWDMGEITAFLQSAKKSPLSPKEIGHWTFEKETRDLALHATLPLVALGSGDNGVYLWDFEVHLNSENGSVSASDEQKDDCRWDSWQAGYSEPTWIVRHHGPIQAVAFSTQGCLLASASSDSTIKLLDLRELKENRTLSGHIGAVNTLAFFSQQGENLLLSGGSDRTVRLWNLEARELPPVVFPGARREINSVAFSPGGKLVLAGSEDGWVHAWTRSTADLANKACDALWRNLSGYEWNRYIGGHRPPECTCPALGAGPDVELGACKVVVPTANSSEAIDIVEPKG